jgi:hypothetical protein
MLLLASCGLSLLLIARARLPRIETRLGSTAGVHLGQNTQSHVLFEALGTALFVLVVCVWRRERCCRRASVTTSLQTDARCWRVHSDR